MSKNFPTGVEAFEQLLYELAGGVATITLNRPERLNAWTAVLEREFKTAILAANASPDVRAIVITGAGRGFCAGADLTLGSQRPSELKPPRANAEFEPRYSYLLGVDKPLIAGINGVVAGIGLCIALHCDVRYMIAGSKLTTAFARRGLIAEHGLAWLLPRLIGPMNALDLLLSGRTIDTAEAAEFGLVKPLDAEGFHNAVHLAALEFVRLSSPRSMSIIRHQVYDALEQSLAEATLIAGREQIASIASSDFLEGVAAFREQRPPEFPSLKQADSHQSPG